MLQVARSLSSTLRANGVSVALVSGNYLYVLQLRPRTNGRCCQDVEFSTGPRYTKHLRELVYFVCR